MKVKQIHLADAAVGSVEIDDRLFAGEINPAVVSQYMYVHNKLRAVGTKKTKGRGEVAGGGKKPWRQKGTGRARVGSSRSPLWVGGGHSHPIVPVLSRRIRMSKKMRNAALVSVLSDRVRGEGVLFVDNMTFLKPQTKKAVEVLNKLNMVDRKVVFVVPTIEESAVKSFANLGKVTMVDVSRMSVVEVVNNKTVIFVADAPHKLAERVFGNEK